MDRDLVINRVGPILIMFILWLVRGGWWVGGVWSLLILLPFLYVPFVERKGIRLLGFRKSNFSYLVLLIECSAIAVTVIFIILYPAGIYYSISAITITAYDLFNPLVLSPFYEETVFRGLALGHAVPVPLGETKKEASQPASIQPSSRFSRRSLLANIGQALLFSSVHSQYYTVPLMLIYVFTIGFVLGLIFLHTRNIAGCILIHSAVNSVYLLMLTGLIP